MKTKKLTSVYVSCNFLRITLGMEKNFQAICRWHVIAQIMKMIQTLKSDLLQI